MVTQNINAKEENLMGKVMGVCVCVCVCELLTLCDSMDCSISGSSIHGIHHARILEWVAIPFSREGDGYAIIKYYCSFKWNQVKKYKKESSDFY